MAKKRGEPPFKVGDLVTSDFFVDERNVVRKVTCVEKSELCSSGWLVSADAGEPCPCCGRSATVIPLVDSPWFKKV